MIFSCGSAEFPCTMTTRGCRIPNLFTFTTSKNWAVAMVTTHVGPQSTHYNHTGEAGWPGRGGALHSDTAVRERRVWTKLPHTRADTRAARWSVVPEAPQ